MKFKLSTTTKFQKKKFGVGEGYWNHNFDQTEKLYVLRIGPKFVSLSVLLEEGLAMKKQGPFNSEHNFLNLVICSVIQLDSFDTLVLLQKCDNPNKRNWSLSLITEHNTEHQDIFLVLYLSIACTCVFSKIARRFS